MSNEETNATYSGKWQGENEVTDVQSDERGYSVSSGGMGFFFAKHWGVEPKVGDKVELNTVGFSEIRGVRINGQQIYLKTDAEAEAEHEEWKKEREREQRAEFERDREKLDAQYEALPEAIRARITRLRTKKDTFRWEMEPYELFLSTEAAKIAAALKTPDEVVDFAKADIERQRELVPSLDYQEHSGNTFGFACKIAHMFLLKPGAVKFMHGAFAPIAGCDGVGCHPLTEAEEAEVAAL